jgi:subtilisin family serine protease
MSARQSADCCVDNERIEFSMFMRRVRHTAVVFALAVSVLGLTGVVDPSASSASPVPQPAILGADSGTAVPGHYIVGLKNNTSLRSQGVANRAHGLVTAHRGRLGHVWDKAILGFSVAMSEADARRLAADPDVAYVQQEQTYHVADAQPNVPSWGLSRIDQRAMPVDTSYNYDGAAQGAGVHAYVLDTGIHIDNPAFGGRASYGTNTDDSTMTADDCNGHGTFVAGVLGSTPYGVAKKVNLVSVRVFNCSGETASDDPIIAGINWVMNNAIKPAVINLSLARTCSDNGVVVACPAGTAQAIVTAEQNAIAAGIPVVTAAGNDNADACDNPIGAAGGTINVAAVDKTDSKSSFSDFGPCVDMWAPGENITSVGGIAGKPDPRSDDGTSFAAPHVAGAVAVLMSTPQFKTATPAQISAKLDSDATLGAISGLDNESPNKLLFLRPTVGSSAALGANSNGRLDLFGVNAGGSLFMRTQNADTAPTSNFVTWNSWAQSNTSGWASVNAQTNQNGLIELAGLTNIDTVWHRQQAAVNTQAWLGLQQLDGSLMSVSMARNKDGTLEMFGANRQGQIFYQKQNSPGSMTWGARTQLGFGSTGVSVAAAPDVNGFVNIFIADSHGNIWKTAQSSLSTDTWPAPAMLTDPNSRAMTAIAAARDSDGRIELMGTDGAVAWHRAQAAPGSAGWQPWTAFGAATVMHIAAAAGGDGRVEVIGVDNQGNVLQSMQSAVGSATYSGWAQIDGILRG